MAASFAPLAYFSQHGWHPPQNTTQACNPPGSRRQIIFPRL